jgi:hypothetical protein
MRHGTLTLNGRNGYRLCLSDIRKSARWFDGVSFAIYSVRTGFLLGYAECRNDAPVVWSSHASRPGLIGATQLVRTRWQSRNWTTRGALIRRLQVAEARERRLHGWHLRRLP